MTMLLQLPLRPLLFSLGLLAAAGAAALLMIPRSPEGAPALRPQTVVVPPGSFLHRLDGEYSRDGRPVDAPRVEVRITAPLEIMRYQVTAAEYASCVAAGACRRLDAPASRGDLPVTGDSHCA